MCPATLLKLPAALPRPTLASLVTSDDPLHIELKPILRLAGRLSQQLRLILCLVGGLLLADAAEELSTPLPGPQLLRQLITALLAVELILGLIRRYRLREDCLAISEKSRLDSRLAFPAIFVPSIATTSRRISPACAHNPST